MDFFKEKNNKIGRISLPNFKILYSPKLWCWQDDKHIHQWNRLENPEIEQHICSQLIFFFFTKVPVQFIEERKVFKVWYRNK